MNWKDTYTKIFLKNLNIAVTQATLKEYMPQWWQNTRAKDEGGLRLTDEGLRVIVEDLQLSTYDVPYPKDFHITTQTIIFLDKFITCPYYMGPRSITVTEENKALELHHFSGDIRKYGLTKAMKRQNSG
jgi:hypothetical protein